MRLSVRAHARRWVVATVAAALLCGPAATAVAAPEGGDLMYRYYKSDGTHFYTAVQHEARLAMSYPDYRYEGVVGAINFAGADTALYRFYKNDGTHFFTASANEAEQAKSYPDYKYEGVAGQVSPVPGDGLVPIYRFYKKAAGTHFYTSSEHEKNQVLSYPQYGFEGIAYYIKAADGAAPQPYPQPTPAPQPPVPTPQPPAPQPPAPQPPHYDGVTPGAFCSPVGATGTSNRGVAMICSINPPDTKARWRAA